MLALTWLPVKGVEVVRCVGFWGPVESGLNDIFRMWLVCTWSTVNELLLHCEGL